MFSNTVLQPWLVLPLAGLMMLVVAAHIGATHEGAQPRSRKRIRVANGWVMLLTLPLLAAGFGVINHQTHPRLFALVWLAAIGLLLICILLAIADVVNTLRIARGARDRAGLRAALEAASELRARRDAERDADGARD